MDLARLLSDPSTSRVCLRAFLRNEEHEHSFDVDDDVLTVLIRTLKHANEREVQALVASTLAVVTSGADDSKRLAATKKGVVRPLIALCLRGHGKTIEWIPSRLLSCPVTRYIYTSKDFCNFFTVLILHACVVHAYVRHTLSKHVII